MNTITKSIVIYQSEVNDWTKHLAYPLAKLIEFSNELGAEGLKVLSVKSKDFNFLLNGASTTYLFECVHFKEHPELNKNIVVSNTKTMDLTPPSKKEEVSNENSKS